MSWRAGPGAGFSTGRPWLPVAPDAAERNVARQSAEPDSVLSFYRRLIELRRRLPVLGKGTLELLEAGDADVLAYIRRLGDDAALVLLNFGARSTTVDLPAPAAGRAWRIALSTHDRAGTTELVGRLELAGLEAIVALDG